MKKFSDAEIKFWSEVLYSAMTEARVFDLAVTKAISELDQSPKERMELIEKSIEYFKKVREEKKSFYLGGLIESTNNNRQ